MSVHTHDTAVRHRDDLRLPRWVVAWFTVTALIQTYDACYELLGSISHRGGPLAWLWPGHVYYSTFDHRYAGFDAFGSAQSWANLLEVIALVWVLTHRRRFSAVVVGLVVLVTVCLALAWWVSLLLAGVPGWVPDPAADLLGAVPGVD